MPEPQRADGSGAEGEDSVSSVSLELITEEYECRRFNMSESVHSKSKEIDLKEMGAITHLCPLKASKVRIHTPLGLNSSPRASPATLGRPGSRWSWTPSMGPGHFLAPWKPWVPRGPPIAPMDCRRTPKEQNGHIWPYIKK
ncbi:hypothetical protein O181_133907 [Austropuccinia psidii MF-1]|uniref:Uncharacterized protein n=1 Tax=Austropuccinia psidii MF-1 TaxID=1389203 RepID=A0A9Q3L7H0_9BASI|nr:hypothetical protein [Austropuccinia psidii MF-1]